MAGRGFGKTRVGAEDISDYARKYADVRVALVGKTSADCRDTMVEGESGLLSVLPPSALRGGSVSTAWNRSLGEVFFSNGAKAKCFTAEEPDRLRGPQHHRAWADELAAWKYPETWDQLMFGLRLGAHPQAVVTTTPRPVDIVRKLLKAETTVKTFGSTYDNLANLAPAFAAQILAKYEGTRLGRQELMAELLDDVPGALWTLARIDALRLTAAPDLARVVVAIDPAGGSEEHNDETGILICGRDSAGHGYVLADRSCRAKPEQWATRAIAAYDEFGADRIVAEKNYGGDMVEATIRSVRRNVPVTIVTASRGKKQRAEPISALYEQSRVHHIGTDLELLEDQMTTWLPDGGRSPDRMDALVWALSELMMGESTFSDYAAQVLASRTSPPQPTLPELARTA